MSVLKGLSSIGGRGRERESKRLMGKFPVLVWLWGDCPGVTEETRGITAELFHTCALSIGNLHILGLDRPLSPPVATI